MTIQYLRTGLNTIQEYRALRCPFAILELATNFWLLVLSILHNSALNYTLRPNVIVTLTW